jgi:hypothetical protein
LAFNFSLNSIVYETRYLQVYLSQTKDAANRRSKVTGTVMTLSGYADWYSTGATTVTVGGVVRYTRPRETNGYGQSQRGFIGNIGEFYINHDTAGNASVSVEISTAIYNSTQKSTSGTWTLDNIGVATSACGSPTACSLSATVSEGNVTLSWSGATPGTNNSISAYEIQYSESNNNSDWGSWTYLTTVTTTETSGSFSVSPPTTRGYFRRFHVRTRGSAGASYYSPWKTSTNSVRKNIPPSAPTLVTASPETYSTENVTLTWSGASGGTSAIKGYQIASQQAWDNSYWGAWDILDRIDLSASSGSYTPKVSRSPGMYTRYGVWTIDALDVYSGEKVSNSVLCNITACSAPTSIDISPTIAESTATLRWSGASGGAGNAITGYEVQYQNSSDGSYWGNWTFYGTMPTTDGFYAVEVNAPPTRGSYRRFRVRTKGTAGEQYYSQWVISNSYRKNLLATPPTTFTASPLVYESGNISLVWSGTVAGTSAIKRYVIQQSASDNNSAWSDWATLTTVTTSDTSGNATVTPPATWKYLRFRISVTDSLSGVSPYTTSNSIKKNIPPLPVIIEAPKAGGVTYNRTPRLLIQTQAELDGLPQTIYVTATDGRVYNSKDNPAMFSTSGSSATGIKTVFTNPRSVFAAYNISVVCKDEYSYGTAVTRTFRISQTNFDTITANTTHVKARHITDLRFAVNNVRGYYDLPVYAWEHEIIPGRTNAAYWVYHVIELRAAIQGVVDKINTFGTIIPKISWLPLGNGRPRADVMAQLATIVIGL